MTTEQKKKKKSGSKPNPAMRIHFRTVWLSGRKSCPSCQQKFGDNESIWSMGEYIRAKWHTVEHFCWVCYDKRCVPIMAEAQQRTGRPIELVGYSGAKLPEWLTYNNVTHKAK